MAFLGGLLKAVVIATSCNVWVAYMGSAIPMTTTAIPFHYHVLPCFPVMFVAPQYMIMFMQIVVLMALLSRMLTWQSAMTGLGVTLSVIPLSIFVGRWQTRIRLRVVQCTDARVKLTGEVLSGTRESVSHIRYIYINAAKPDECNIQPSLCMLKSALSTNYAHACICLLC